MSTTIRRRSKESGFRTPDPPRIPTLSEMIRDGQQSAAKIKRATKEALVEWFAQSERLNIARTHYLLRGGRFSDFARRIGIDRSSAYQLLKLSKHKAAILARCADEGRYYGWETCLYWFERNPDLSWHRSPHGSHTDEYATPIAIFERFGKGCNLDVCATAETAMSSSFYTKEQDGLKLPWRGRVWMNPPYSNISPWCAKALASANAGGTVIALLPAWTDAPWFHEYVRFGRITFIRGKLGFVGQKGFAWFASMVVEWNPQTVDRARRMVLDAVLADP